MSFEWDPAKAEANLLKHGIDFPDVTGVFEDDYALTIADSGVEEERFVTMGVDRMGSVVVVVYTWRGENVRIVSARKAVRSEREAYAKGRDTV